MPYPIRPDGFLEKQEEAEKQRAFGINVNHYLHNKIII
jgi:hypothetical protein